MSRGILQSLAVIAAILLTEATGGPADAQSAPQPAPFSFATIDKIARDRAAKPYADTLAEAASGDREPQLRPVP